MNPRLGGASGFYLYDLSAQPVGVVTIVDDENLAYFDSELDWDGYFASNSEDGFNWFSTDGEWIGYLMPNSEHGYNLFKLDGDWIGFVT